MPMSAKSSMRARPIQISSPSRAKRPLKDGKFDGVYLVSIAPEYFTDFYARLPRADASIASLVRSDGAFLARYPVMADDETRVARVPQS